ncbi:hypothetical protein V7S43_008750 [Phytophthora oleae]|uniref:Uncharacterized protein n=1 Tax=Phytophthora oleae TaxID=2107226 RepID=A0ABD3FJQ2_9STRA
MVKRFREKHTRGQRKRNHAPRVSTDRDNGALSPPTTEADGNLCGDTDTSPIGAHVSFSPAEEGWMPDTIYASVGSSYLTGVISREYVEKGKKKKKEKKSSESDLLELHWTTTQFQTSRHVHGIPRSNVEEGIARYNRLNGSELRADTWGVLCRPYHEEVDGGDLWDEFEEIGEDRETISEDIGEVERVAGMDFQPRAMLNAPDDLYGHDGGTTSPHVRPQF